MKKRLALSTVVLVLICSSVFALPPAYFDPVRSGGVEGGMVFSVDPLSGDCAIGFELYWVSQSRFGAGLTAMLPLSGDGRLGSYSFDGLYYADIESSGRGLVVVPVKLRLGMFGTEGRFGAGLSAGVQWYALPFAFDDSYNMYIAPHPLNADFFMSVKATAELDYAGGKLVPTLGTAVDLGGTIGGGSGSGYVYIVYY
jgi:hypothetical protein